MDEVRVSYEQNLILPHVKLDDVPAVWKALDAAELATPNRGLVTDIIACPGLDYCALANARAIPIAQQIALRFADPARPSWSASWASRSAAASTPAATTTSGPSASSASIRRARSSTRSRWAARRRRTPRWARCSARHCRPTRWPTPSSTWSRSICANGKTGERFLDTFRRTGVAPFKEAVYADAH